MMLRQVIAAAALEVIRIAPAAARQSDPGAALSAPRASTGAIAGASS
jgi:hypothetical protein